MSPQFKQELFACLAGVIVGGLMVANLLPQQEKGDFYSIDNHSDEYHIHADFLIQIEDEVIDLGVAKLMTSAEQQIHSDAHLHNNDGEVVHMHTENISFVEFLESIEIKLEDDCISLNEITRCQNENKMLALYVNESLWEQPFVEYVPADLDRVLLYYGDKDKSLKDSLEAIPDNACLFSGSCPERGIAPPESCGLTCEL